MDEGTRALTRQMGGHNNLPRLYRGGPAADGSWMLAPAESDTRKPTHIQTLLAHVRSQCGLLRARRRLAMAPCNSSSTGEHSNSSSTARCNSCSTGNVRASSRVAVELLEPPAKTLSERAGNASTGQKTPRVRVVGGAEGADWVRGEEEVRELEHAKEEGMVEVLALRGRCMHCSLKGTFTAYAGGRGASEEELGRGREGQKEGESARGRLAMRADPALGEAWIDGGMLIGDMGRGRWGKLLVDSVAALGRDVETQGRDVAAHLGRGALVKGLGRELRCTIHRLVSCLPISLSSYLPHYLPHSLPPYLPIPQPPVSLFLTRTVCVLHQRLPHAGFFCSSSSGL